MTDATSLTDRLANAGSDWIVPQWDAPPSVHALSTTRNGGVSSGACATLDLGAARKPAGADYSTVVENRRRLAQFLPASPVWLYQVHGTAVTAIDPASAASFLSAPPVADAAVTRTPDIVLGVRHADCLPVLFSDRAGTVVAAAHAGWRGLAAGVLEATVRAMAVPPHEIVAWLGPAIGPQMFEVGRDVFDAFCAPDRNAAPYFAPRHNLGNGQDKWFADLYGLARYRLRREGVVAVAGGGHCTMTEADRFFSFRRDKSEGRMATLVWLDGKSRPL